MTIVVAALVGLVLGAVLNLVIQRLPRGRPLFRRPHCTQCQHALSWEALPLVGYLLQRGRCRFCAQPIPKVFPLVELLTAASYAVLVWRHGVTWLTLVYAFFLLAFIVTLFLDWLRHEIYYIVLLPATAVGLLGSLVPGLGMDLRSNLLGLVVGLVFFGLLFVFGHLLFHSEALGLGDVLLAGTIGATAGFYGAVYALTGGIVLAAIGAGLLLFLRRASSKDYMPYGSFLCLAAVLYLCWGVPW